MCKRFPVNIVIELISRVVNFTSSVNTVNEIIKLELCCNAFVSQKSRMLTVLVKLLLHIHVLNKVQVYVIWDIHLNPFYKMGGVYRYIKVSGKSE